MCDFEFLVLVAACFAVGSEARSARIPGRCPYERFYEHYKVKQCTPVYESDNDCPDKFECPKEYLTDDTVCQYNGRTYKAPDRIDSPNPCQKCSCFGSEVRAGILCTSVQCRSATPREGCYKTYSHDFCCPVGEVCADSTVGSEPGLTCNYKGAVYQAGQYIDVNDPCLSCICDENWDEEDEPIVSLSCKKWECMLEKDLGWLKRGCLPIYENTSCCPIDYHCEFSGKEEWYAADSDIPNRDGVCIYNGREGHIGDEIDLKRKNDCTTCKCITPPEFTCIYKQCT